MSDSLLEGHLHRGCGGRYVRQTEPVTIRVSGMSTTVERVFFRCSRCEDVHRTVEQREAAEQEAVATIRAAHELLLPKQIRQLRERLGLTPEQLGDLLYGTPKSIVEGWEKGRYVQNRDTDALLRQLEEREFLVARAARAGVTLPPLPGADDAAGGAAEPGPSIATLTSGAPDSAGALPDETEPDAEPARAAAPDLPSPEPHRGAGG